MPPNQPSDQELQFKKQARRRLVGAIALVLLMVTVLPMILDDRNNEAPPQDIEITIPSQDDADFTSKIIPVDPEDASTTQAVVIPEDEAARPLEQPVPVKAEASSTKPLESAATKPEPVKPAAEQKTAGSKPVAAEQGPFYIQIGVYSDAGNVKKLQDQLQAQGYKSFTEQIKTSKGEKIRLRAGPFSSRLEAEGALAKIKDSGLTGMVVKQG